MENQVSGMKVLACIGGSFIYGAEAISLQVIAHLKKRHEVYCAINGWNDGAFPRRLQELDIPFSAIKLGWLYLTKPSWTLDSLIHAPGAFFSYRSLLRNMKPDVVYHISYRSVFQLYPLLKGNNVLHMHDSVSGRMSGRILRMIDPKVKLYIANSEWVKKGLLDCGINADKIRLVHNGIHFESFPYIPVDFVPGIARIGYVGQISPRKGLDTLITALQIADRQGYAFKLHIFGSGDPVYVSGLRERLRAAGMDGKVEWHGYVTDKKTMYSGMDFTVVPSVLPESFGLTAVEPAVYGRCVIASRAGGLAEIVTDGKTGLLFEPGNAEELSEKLMYLMDHREKSAEMGLAARDWYSKKFSEEAMLQKTENALLELSGGR